MFDHIGPREASSRTAAWLCALAALKRSGSSVEPSDIPGLTYVNGVELTIGQIIDLASRIETK